MPLFDLGLSLLVRRYPRRKTEHYEYVLSKRYTSVRLWECPTSGMDTRRRRGTPFRIAKERLQPLTPAK
jgi:hypothetical protein